MVMDVECIGVNHFFSITRKLKCAIKKVSDFN